ncbi:GNAT family N-acetyltransferase [Brachybacterium sp. YJGR34]|uniref:GNAT family N-acetyltransferase n=1 Tax=Brachybacterium sp. YJGR34 TaxID=2059911 RepID=UPI00130086D7|nr:GNAT family N-acetyltransferase [Brachybacterium sp. YJGR34]
MQVSIEPLRLEDARAIVEAEDEQTVRWLSEAKSTVEGTTEFIAQLARDAERGKPKRVFGIWLDGTFVGTIDFDPDVTDGLEPGDVNIAYGVAPSVRGRGVAARAVELICATIQERAVGKRAVIRTDARNAASSRVAEKAGFVHLRDVHITTETLEDGSPVVMHVYGRDLT